MNVYVRGNPINLPAEFVLIDPITHVAVPTDPTTVTFTILAPDGTAQAFTQADANVSNPGYGLFVCALDPQLPVGIYHYNAVGAGAVVAQSPDEVFEIVESALDVPAPPPRPVMGPCSPWIAGQDVAACARVAYDQDAYVFDTVAYNASLALYEISGRQFPGICERKVRPVRDACGCWLGGPVSYGMGPWFWTAVPWGYAGGAAWANERGDRFGCSPMSRWKLAGYPVNEIVEVKIDGDVLPEFDGAGARNYRLDKWRYLVRMDDPGPPARPRAWPGCQNMSLDDDQPGTFSVKYRWGAEVPQLGRDAAVEIANQLYLACGGRECVLPAGVTKVVRQGIEIERGLLANWMDTTKGTGLVQTDLFLAAYAGGQRRGRKSAIWSPDVQGFGRRVGVNE